MAKRATKAKRAPADFDDEDAVLKEVAKDLGEDADDLKIKEDGGLGSFGEGTVYRISTPRGGREWCVVQDHDTAYKLAVAVVTQDLESEPEIFNKDFLESHIDKMKLARELESDLRSMAEDDVREWTRTTSGARRGARAWRCRKPRWTRTATRRICATRPRTS